MKPPFVPTNFTIPLRLVNPDFILRKLTIEDVEQDYEAVMSSKESLRHIFAPQDDWPADEMTLQDNLQDLQRHQDDFDQRKGFTYTVVSPEEDACIGCVYIYPWKGKQYDAQVYFWVRDAVKPRGLEEKLGQVLHHWLADVWPFRAPAFPGRQIPWDIWEQLRQAQED